MIRYNLCVVDGWYASLDISSPQPCQHAVQEYLKVVRKTDLNTGLSGRIVGYDVVCVKCRLVGCDRLRW